MYTFLATFIKMILQFSRIDKKYKIFLISKINYDQSHIKLNNKTLVASKYELKTHKLFLQLN
jgi:hypothetical protein